MSAKDPYDLLKDMTFVFGKMDEPDAAARYRAMQTKYMGMPHVPLDALRNAMLRMAGAMAKANEPAMELALDNGDMVPAPFDPDLMSFEHEQGRIFNPTRSRDNRSYVDPGVYGFDVYHTGGGCMALRKDLDGGCYFLLTDSDGDSMPGQDEYETALLGLYSPEGDTLAMIEVGKIPPNPDSLLGFIEARKLSPVSVEDDLRDLAKLLVSEGRGYDLDGPVAELDMFSPEEKMELAAFLKHTRAVLSEDHFWDIAFPALNQGQDGGMAP